MEGSTLHPGVEKFLSSSPKKMLINGEFVSSDRTFSAINPAEESVLVEVYEAGEREIDAAVQAAQAAFEGKWSSFSPYKREKLLLRLADLIEAHKEELAQLETLDNGKPIQESLRIDLPTVVHNFRYFAGWASKIYGETIPVSVGSYFAYTLKEPLGVVAQIIPWNFPLVMCAWKLAPALACGNTVVLKPAEQTPLTALRLAELVVEAGFPPGVVNICPGFGSRAGVALVSHGGIRKVAFTGSTAVGREILEASGKNLIPVSLELGGKSPQIIFEDADLKAAVRAAFHGVFLNQGQICTAGSRIFVQRSIYKEFLDQLVQRVEKLVLGPGIEPQTQMGPLVSEEQWERVMGYVKIGREEGAVLAKGGKRPEHLSKGYFMEPTIFYDVKNGMRIAQEEIFGPVAAVIPFETEEEVIGMANGTIYGLAAGVWTKDLRRAHRLSRLLEAGSVWVNCYGVFDPAVPFGGYKQSGFGREGGKDVIELYTQTKSVWVGI